MQFPFEALDSGAIAVRRPISRRVAPGRKLVRITDASDSLVVACRQAAAEAARENVIWISLFLSALALLAMSFAL